MAGKGKASQVNVRCSLGELEAELEKRTAERDEALAREAAIAEVLEIINASAGNLAPVLEAILEKALALCAASFGDLSTYDGKQFLAVATRGFPPALVNFYRDPFTPGPRSYFGRLVSGEKILHISDMAAQYSSGQTAPMSHAGVEPGRALVELGNARTGLLLALRKDDAVLGAFRIFRQEVWPFTGNRSGYCRISRRRPSARSGWRWRCARRQAN